MRQSLKFKKYSLLDLEKILKNKNINFVNNFYKDFIKNYKSLDKTYKFNVDLNEKYIFKQIKSILIVFHGFR